MQMYRLHTNHAGHGYNAQKSWETTLYGWSQRQRKKKAKCVIQIGGRGN